MPNKEIIPRRVHQLTQAYIAMELEDAKEAGMLGYMARSVAQATMPHTDPKNMYFERTNGIITLSMVAARPQIGLPYGSIPRILMGWICTEAVRTKEPVLYMGRSQAEFLNKLQMEGNGATIKRLRDQALRLFTSSITVTRERGDEHGIELENLQIAKRSSIFWSPKNPNQTSLWESTLQLNQDFFEEVIKAPVPIDLRAYHALRKSPLALDIYTWLTYRVFVMRAKGRSEVMIPWQALMLQFGSNYGAGAEASDEDPAAAKKRRQAMYDFKRKFLARLKEVLLFYPEAKGAIRELDQGLLLRPAKLHIKQAKPNTPHPFLSKRKASNGEG